MPQPIENFGNPIWVLIQWLMLTLFESISSINRRRRKEIAKFTKKTAEARLQSVI